MVHARSASIFASKSGNLATALTFSSHGCCSTFEMLLVSLPIKRAAWTISTGYTDAGRMMATSGSGWRAMGMASFCNSAALRFAGADGGGAAPTGAGAFVPCAVAECKEMTTMRMESIGFIGSDTFWFSKFYPKRKVETKAVVLRNHTAEPLLFAVHDPTHFTRPRQGVRNSSSVHVPTRS